MKEFNRKVMEKNKFNNNKFFDDYEDMLLYDKKINGSEKRIDCVFWKLIFNRKIKDLRTIIIKVNIILIGWFVNEIYSLTLIK